MSESSLTLDEPLQVWGSGFLPGEPVTLSLVVDDIVRWTVGSRDAEQPTANASGAFTASYDSIGGTDLIRSRAPGIKTIIAEGADGSKASAPVVITSVAPPKTSPSTSLTVNPVVQDGDVTVWGAGFKPNEVVTISIVAAVGGIDKIIVGGSANDSGAFALEGSIGGADEPIPAGTYTLLAVGDRGSEATTPLVVLKEK